MRTINSNHLEYINKELMNMDENTYSHKHRKEDARSSASHRNCDKKYFIIFYILFERNL